MSTFFSFRYQPSFASAPALVLFTLQRDINAADLWDAINEDVGTNLSPSSIIIIVRNEFFQSIAKQLANLVRQRFQWRVDLDVVSVVLTSFGKDSSLSHSSEITTGRIRISASEFQTLKSAGVLYLFKMRNGLLLPGSSTHYIHPSGRHSNGFLRAANLLIEGPEVEFLAMCLLKFLEKPAEYIWVDTSSISSLAYAAILLRREMDQNFSVPLVSSFSSYERIEKAKFSHQQKSLVLVSATTSGNLSRKLVSKGFPEDQVVTLFSLAKDKSGLKIFCDLSEDEEVNPMLNYSASSDFSAADCPMCKSGSKPVRFVGDQFLADAIVYSPYTIVGTDASLGLKKTMEQYAGRRIFGLRARRPSEVSANEMWIDLNKALKVKHFSNTIFGIVERYAPSSTSLVVHSGDPGCSKLASTVAKKISVHLGKSVALSEIGTLSPSSAPTAGAVVAVVGCIGSGRAAQAISLRLRDITGDRPRLYIAGVAKHVHTDAYSKLKGDLVYNGQGYKHDIISGVCLALPTIPVDSAWASEHEILLKIKELSDTEPNQGEDLTILLDKRTDELAELAKGGVDCFFWSDAAGNQLALRQTFAFWPFKYAGRSISHGDIFVTIASIMEALRSGQNPKILHTNFYHTYLSPACFGRYNDGVIQASLLRAALPQELNYGADDVASEAMLNILRSISAGWNTPVGEALPEFLMAIASKRMTLTDRHLAEFLDTLPGNFPIVDALGKFCRAEILLH